MLGWRGRLTLLGLDSLLEGAAHVVLGDVISGSQSPQRVSGALSPAGRTHRAPVLCDGRGQPEDGKHTRTPVTWGRGFKRREVRAHLGVLVRQRTPKSC